MSVSEQESSATDHETGGTKSNAWITTAEYASTNLIELNHSKHFDTDSLDCHRLTHLLFSHRFDTGLCY
jgi:hypothetical protein